MFWEISDILWKCFGFHWLAKLAEIIKTCGKKQKTKKTKTVGFCIIQYMHVSIFIFRYLPAITCSHFKFRPSPIHWPTVCLPIYLYIIIYIYILYVYMYACIWFYIYMFTCNHLQPFQVQTLPNLLTYCLPTYLSICIYLYICMYVCMCYYIYIFTCNHLQSF